MIEWINANLATFWISLGFLLLAVEVVAFGMATGVLLFGSLGALITGALLWFGVIDASWMYSVAAFTIASIGASLLLWVPMKRLQGEGSELGQDTSSDLIGREFIVDEQVRVGQPGKHKYSGIDWRVEIDPAGDIDTIAAGERVRVSKVGAGIFYVKPVGT